MDDPTRRDNTTQASLMASAKTPYITTGSENPLLPQLLEGFQFATEISIAVAFIRVSGMRLLVTALKQALFSGKSLKILTSDYLRLTEPEALETLLELKALGAEVRIFESVETGFHMKAYLFMCNQAGQLSPHGYAFVGSSNISEAALLKSVEWNLRVDFNENAERFTAMLDEFARLYSSPPTCELNEAWLSHYRSKWTPRTIPSEVIQQLVKDPGTQYQVVPTPQFPEPNSVQIEALEQLKISREQGLKRGLVVLATGLGKTWLSAFDSQAIQSQSILFIAHRQEILLQAQSTFEQIYPHLKTGLYTGALKELGPPILFASIQTLGRLAHLQLFKPDHFDYIVVDEFHHAAAKSYQKLLDYFEPRFLLGLTATPDRTDQADILDFCDGNLIFRLDLFEGINRALLSPFRYYGIADQYVDYTRIAWRQGKFVDEDLELHLNTQRRAEHIYQQWLEKRQRKTLAFCLSKKHAEFMAAYFQQQGIETAAIHSSSEIDRHTGLAGLASGKYAIIFSVDLFNEGIDIPEIDTVMMLRPTESKILFLQQLGRGLRKLQQQPDKKLNVLDFIGNHHLFLNKPQALFGLNPTHSDVARLVKDYLSKSLAMPLGCEVFYDLNVIEIFQHLSQPKSADQIIATYQDLKENKGRRPTATEIYQAGVSFTKLRQGWGSWFDFVKQQGDLNPQESACLLAVPVFLKELETTKMTNSLKLVTLEAWLQLDGFINPPHLKKLCRLSLQLVQRRSKLNSELPHDFQDLNSIQDMTPKQWLQWQTYWEKNAINDLTDGQTFPEKANFYLENKLLKNKLSLEDLDTDAFREMAHELIAYRLFQYQPQTPLGQTSPVPRIEPAQGLPVRTGFDLSRELFQSFKREEIPPLLGLGFNQAIWNTGHVSPKGLKIQVLLVTLIKAGKIESQRYHDYFIDASTFHWQSQNQTKPQSPQGLRLKNHRENQEQILLFVRKRKLGPDKKSAPFIYCGELDFESWEGSQPINVIWNLQQAVPPEIFQDLS